MRNFKIVFFALVLSVSGLFAFRTTGEQATKDETVLKLVIQAVSNHHYSPLELNDEFSRKVFRLYLDRLDYGKRYFTQSDVDVLRAFETQIDDQIRDGKYYFFEMANAIYKSRLSMVKGFYKAILIQPFDFTTRDSIALDADKMPWAQDINELKERWFKLLKYNVLSQIATELDLQEKSDSTPAKSFSETEEAARVKIMKNYDDWARRIDKLEQEDQRSLFLNTISNVYDPHTGYFPPADKENFDIQMSGQLEGIGATLREMDGYIKVVEIVPGSACYRQGELQENDIILKVGQGKEEPIDIADMRVDDAVKYIRGPKGTEVRLTVKKPDGSTKVIAIVRDIVVLAETYARSAIVKNAYSSKGIGYIRLPKFYADFQNAKGRFCAKDVRIEVEKLKAHGIEGLVIDLRNNGGGSLSDVVEMAGLFVDEGPMVQVRSRQGEAQVMSDNDPKTLYDGPLVILVNGSSASASEIMAAAIQDYKRGIIVGAPTFGKGTVQRFIDLDKYLQGEQEMKPLGSVKVTTQKFYRISGGATQLKGVTPDVVLPDAYTYLDLGEKEQEYVMPWDEIAPCPYKPWKLTTEDYARIRRNSRDRTGKNPLFQLADENAQRMKAQQEDHFKSLQLEDYRAEEKRLKEEADSYKKAFQPIKGVTVVNPDPDRATIDADTFRIKMNKEWIEGLQKDIYLHEACAILKDLR
ncbi:MAG: hypothetical protein RLZZ165_1250 [Bacteroidota bacterium]|jgi:carboxyl-terminal processing protease